MADTEGKPKDVDREFVCLYLLFDENGSGHYRTLPRISGKKKGAEKPPPEVAPPSRARRLHFRTHTAKNPASRAGS